MTIYRIARVPCLPHADEPRLYRFQDTMTAHTTGTMLLVIDERLTAVTMEAPHHRRLVPLVEVSFTFWACYGRNMHTDHFTSPIVISGAGGI